MWPGSRPARLKLLALHARGLIYEEGGHLFGLEVHGAAATGELFLPGDEEVDTPATVNFLVGHIRI
jgi:hypothetical protein